MMKYIDLETYPRRSHYEFFKSMAYPYMGLTANVDVTRPVQAAKEMDGSPFLACLWVAANAANRVNELRQRIVEDRIVEFDHCDTSHTVAREGGLFGPCQTDCRMHFPDFQHYGRLQQEAARNATGFVSPDTDETSLIFVSCVPWVSFTQCIQPVPIPADSNPRIVFGKFIPEGDRIMMPLHIQCNHALVDGIHLAQFYQAFEELAASL